MNVVAFDTEFGSGKDNPVVVADDDSNQVLKLPNFSSVAVLTSFPRLTGNRPSRP